MKNIEFIPFPKIPRLSREIIITEKLDGTNAQVHITEYGDILAGSRTRWITPESDNYGFASWVLGNKDELLKLGPGSHFGEWWGRGIQRGYGLNERKFSLFNSTRWETERPECCDVVPVIFQGMFDTQVIDSVLATLKQSGSIAAPGFMNPEGVVVFHVAGRVVFKKLLENDGLPKELIK